MTNFSTPLAVRVTQEQWKEIAPELERLGYKKAYSNYSDNWLKTYPDDSLPVFQTISEAIVQYSDGYTILDTYDKDLILALAAMREGEEFFPGEWIKTISNGGNHTSHPAHQKEYRMDTLYRIREIGEERYEEKKPVAITEEGPVIYLSSDYCTYVRKATKEEILQHFQQHVLKQFPSMEKKILGFKLKENCNQYEEAAATICGYGNGVLDTLYIGKGNFSATSRDKENLEKAGVLDLWFEPVYEEEFKKDEWVVIVKDNINRNTEYDGKTTQFIGYLSPDESQYQEGYRYRVVYPKDSSSPLVVKEIRKATEQEIKAATKITVAGYDARFSGMGQVNFGCKEFSLEDIQRYLYLLETTNSTITVEGTPITKELLQRILSRM